MAVRSTVFIACSTANALSMSVGSGTLLSQSLVLTNAHVVMQSNFRDAMPQIRVFAPRSVTGTPRFSSAGSVMFVDVALDVAIVALRNEMPSSMVPATIASEQAREGDVVFCIGFPEALDESSFSLGYVRSKICGTIRGLPDLSTTIPSFPGNSGSGIFSVHEGIDGTRTPEVVGILTYTMDASTDTLTCGLSLSVLKQVLENTLRRTRSVFPSGMQGCLPRYNLGLALSIVDPFTYRYRNLAAAVPALTSSENQIGYFVMRTVSNSAAARALLKPGDIVLGMLNVGVASTAPLVPDNVTLFTEEETIGERLVYPVQNASFASESPELASTRTLNLIVNKFGRTNVTIVPIHLSLIPETFPALSAWALLGLKTIPTSKHSFANENSAEPTSDVDAFEIL